MKNEILDTLSTFFSIMFAIIAITVIGSFDGVLENTEKVDNGTIISFVSFFVSCAYLHWFTYWFFFPTHRLSVEQNMSLHEISKNKYKKSLSSVVVGLGYFFVVVQALDLLTNQESNDIPNIHSVASGNVQADMPNLAMIAAFLIVVGTAARGRELTRALVDHLIESHKTTESEVSTND